MMEIDSEDACQPQGGIPALEPRPVDAPMVIWMVGLTCLWGLNAIGIKAVTDEMPPLLAVDLRGLVALMLMVPFALWRRERLGFTGWQWVHGTVVGVLFALEFGLFYVGAQYTSGGHMAIFINTAQIRWAVPRIENHHHAQGFGAFQQIGAHQGFPLGLHLNGHLGEAVSRQVHK